MSFWEDRFVYRPHASAASGGSSSDGSDQPSSGEPEVGRAWSYVPDEPASAHDEPGQTFEPDEPAETPDVVAEVESEDAQEADEQVADDVSEVVDDLAWEHDDEVAALAETDETDEAPAEEKRRGLFRRRKPVSVEATAEVVTEDEAFTTDFVEDVEFEQAEPELEPSTEFVGNGHAWSYVPETSNELHLEATESADRSSADEDADRWAEAAAAIDADAAPAEQKRRGLFRRRKPVSAEPVVSDEAFALVEPEQDEPEFAFDSNPAIETADSGRSWSYVAEDTTFTDDEPEPALEAYEPDEVVAEHVETFPETELEPEEAHEEDEQASESGDEWGRDEEIAAIAEADETPVETKRRGLFRRRKPDPVETVSEHDGSETDAEPESFEDDAFEDVPMYATWSSETSDVDESPAAADEPEHDETTTFVFGASEDSESFASDETEPEYEADPVETPAWELESDSSEELEQTDEPADEPTEVPTEVVELEPADTFAEYEPEFEPVFEAEAEEPFDVPVTSLQDEPVVLRKRNGGGSGRGKKVVGLKVGASQIAAAVVTGSGDRPSLVEIARRPLEAGVVVDGELRDPDALTHALKSFFKDHGLPVRNVRLGLSSSRVGVRTFDIAGIEDDAKFDNAVRFKAHEVLPVAAHESVLDYRVVEERYTESGETSRRVLLVVAPRDQVVPYIDACRNAGLRLAGVDLEAFGLLRAFVPPLGSRSRSEDSATVVAAIGHEASTLLVAGGGVCEFTRVFDWGGGDLQAAIAEELGVPLMEAATILTHLSLTGPGRHLDSLDSDTRSRALEAVRTRLTPFARELVSSLQFYQTQPESLGIREILITGGTSHLEGLADALHQMIGVNVSVGDPLGRVAVETEIPVALDATIGSLAVPIGLAIEDEAARSVNLLPKDARQTRKRPNFAAIGIPVAVALPLVALVFLFVQASGAASDRQAQVDAVRAEIEKLPEPTHANIDPTLAGVQAARATAVAQVLGGRLRWERVLGDIARVLPAGISLTELDATTPQPTAPETAPTTEDASSTSSTTSTTTPTPPPAAAVPSTPTGVTVTGYALEYESIARALARIQAVPSLANAQLQSATPAMLGSKHIIQFTIVADLATPTPGGVQ